MPRNAGFSNGTGAASVQLLTEVPQPRRGHRQGSAPRNVRTAPRSVQRPIGRYVMTHVGPASIVADAAYPIKVNKCLTGSNNTGIRAARVLASSRWNPAIRCKSIPRISGLILANRKPDVQFARMLTRRVQAGPLLSSSRPPPSRCSVGVRSQDQPRAGDRGNDALNLHRAALRGLRWGRSCAVGQRCPGHRADGTGGIVARGRLIAPVTAPTQTASSVPAILRTTTRSPPHACRRTPARRPPAPSAYHGPAPAVCPGAAATASTWCRSRQR